MERVEEGTSSVKKTRIENLYGDFETTLSSAFKKVITKLQSLQENAPLPIEQLIFLLAGSTELHDYEQVRQKRLQEIALSRSQTRIEEISLACRRFLEEANSGQLVQEVNIAAFSTFELAGESAVYEIGNLQDLILGLEIAEKDNVSWFVIGNGSDVVFGGQESDSPSQRRNPVLMHMGMKGIQKVAEDEQDSSFLVMAGENLDDVIKYLVERNLKGPENLVHIPATIGGAVFMNAGAYGPQMSDFVEQVLVYDTALKEVKFISKEACEFGYRKSVFHGKNQGKYVILGAVLKVSKTGLPNLGHGRLKEFFQNIPPEIFEELDPPSECLAGIVSSIRRQVVPLKPSVGSFFKNVELLLSEFSELRTRLQKSFPDQGEYIQKRLAEFASRRSGEQVRIPTAFLIEICGLKGRQCGGVKIDSQAPLVFVKESADCQQQDVIELCRETIEVVYEKTGIWLRPEAILTGFSAEQLTAASLHIDDITKNILPNEQYLLEEVKKSVETGEEIPKKLQHKALEASKEFNRVNMIAMLQPCLEHLKRCREGNLEVKLQYFQKTRIWKFLVNEMLYTLEEYSQATENIEFQKIIEMMVCDILTRVNEKIENCENFYSEDNPQISELKALPEYNPSAIRLLMNKELEELLRNIILTFQITTDWIIKTSVETVHISSQAQYRQALVHIARMIAYRRLLENICNQKEEIWENQGFYLTIERWMDLRLQKMNKAS